MDLTTPHYPTQMHGECFGKNNCDGKGFYFDNGFPQETLYSFVIDFYPYEIQQMKNDPMGTNLKYLLMCRKDINKFNVYATIQDFNPLNLVQYYKPIPFWQAKILFPQITIEKYGFEKVIYPWESK